MAIITISREMGSGGGLVCQMITNSLNYKTVDKVTIENVMAQYGLTSFNALYGSVHNIWSKFDTQKKELINLLNQSIRAFAKFDNTLIVGRGGFVVLQGFQNVLNVLLRAPLEYRIRNAMDTEGIKDILTSENTVRQSDTVRQSFLETFYGVNANAANMFDLVIDTSKIPLNMAGVWIMEAAKAIDQKIIRPEFTTASIEVDPVLAGVVAKIMEQ